MPLHPGRRCALPWALLFAAFQASMQGDCQRNNNAAGSASQSLEIGNGFHQPSLALPCNEYGQAYRRPVFLPRVP